MPPFAAAACEPHVTIAHPRTSRDGPGACSALRNYRANLEFVVTELILTATTDTEYQLVDRFPLGRS
jgi:hypothetical protein